MKLGRLARVMLDLLAMADSTVPANVFSEATVDVALSLQGVF